ncbi:hypothetical protein ABPG72_020570 [Tetrahymena utriculariae]
MVDKNGATIKIQKYLENSLGNGLDIQQRQIKSLSQKFRYEGRTQTSSIEGSGRKREVRIPDNIERVRDLIEADPYLSIQERTKPHQYYIVTSGNI